MGAVCVWYGCGMGVMCGMVDVGQVGESGGDGLLKVDQSGPLRAYRLPVLFAFTYQQVQFVPHEVCRARFSISASSRHSCI